MPDKQLPAFFFYLLKSAIQRTVYYEIKIALNPVLQTIQTNTDNHLQPAYQNPGGEKVAHLSNIRYLTVFFPAVT